MDLRSCERKGTEAGQRLGHPNVRHIKVKSQAQPFNPQWTTYFKERGRKPNIRETVKKVIGTVKSLFGNPDTPKT